MHKRSAYDSEEDARDSDDEAVKPTAVKQSVAKLKVSERKDKASSDENLPWVEKYRPSELSELISHQEIINTISRLIDTNKMPHLLLYGPPGTGKTSTVLACARKLNGPAYKSMILELNASDDRGIDVVREQIKDFASSKKLFSTGYKLIILDEADAMTQQAQFALRRVIETYTANARFCLICNYINKIIPALQSRCTRFRFGPLQREQIEGRLKYVVEKEKVKITEDGLGAVIKLAQGDMRKCLNVLQACHMGFPEVTQDAVYLCTGNPLPSDIDKMLVALNNKTFKEAYDFIAEMQVTKGLSLVDIVAQLHEHLFRTSYPPKVQMMVIDKLSDIEHRLSFGTNEKLQLGALVGVFQLAREQVTAAAAAGSAGSAGAAGAGAAGGSSQEHKSSQ